MITRRKLLSGAAALAAYSTLPAQGALTVQNLVGFGAGGRASDSLITILADIGLTSDLKLCLDAGDISSWPGSGQDWIDTSSFANADEFFRGSSAGDSNSDPTFTGTAGGLSSSDYWACAGATYFRYGAANETWMKSLHKDSAKFTMFSVAKRAATYNGVRNGFCGTRAESVSDVGWWFVWNSTAKLTWGHTDDAGNMTEHTVDTATDGTSIHMVGLSLDEAAGAGGSFFWQDGAYMQVSSSNTFNGEYSSPATADPTRTMEIMALGNGERQMISDGRFYALAIWQGVALTKAQLDSIRNEFRLRTGF